MDAQELIRVEALQGPQLGPAWTFTASPGTVLWIPDGEDSGMSWLDWLTGLAPPPAGRVFWQGVDWRERGPRAAAAERGRMGCVFAAGGLVMNLDLDENVWLPSRIHRRAGAAEEIERWARFFGVWPLPPERAPAVRERDRRRLLWTRAFAGRPAALVLEQPLREAPAEDRTRLVDAVKQARAEGSAVIWLEEALDIATRTALEPLAVASPESI